LLKTTFPKEFYLIKGKFIPKIHGGKGGGGGKGCFAAGTLIDTRNGKVPIEKITPGLEVLSFDSEGNYSFNKVTETYFHSKQRVSKYTLWNKVELLVTDNHWAYTENGTFKEFKHFSVDEALVGSKEEKYPIVKVETNYSIEDVYNFTVENNHTYIANSILVHNKGGGKGGGGGGGGGSEADDTLFSTDLLFVLSALGEGPIYRVNPNGPQDIEINEGPIDDLLNIEGDGLLNTDVFYYAYNTGTLNQAPLGVFGQEVTSPQSLANPVTLKKGNRPGVPPSSIRYMSTTVGTAWDQLTFKFNIANLAVMDNQGNINGHSLEVQVSVYDISGANLLVSINKTVSGKTTSTYKFEIDVIIPKASVSSAGYKFSVVKLSDDSANSKTQDSVVFYGWDEIQYGERAYPRTSLIGYVIKATDEFKGTVPTVTSMVKGLLCRVPSNYNQPILENGEIDWRQVEVSDALRASSGFYLQKFGSTLQSDTNPVIYDGLWDGSFVYNWTQNPVWIVFDLLTNSTYGLGIPLNNVDKYNFYKVAQYCDAVEQKTGKFVGVSATADGSWRYKPRGSYSGNREVLIGLPNGTSIKERRFICDIILSSKKQVMDTINQITGLFRGILFYSAGKLALNVDMPDELPMAIFNETNIIDGSLILSGTKESDIITGVEVNFIDPLNHFRRETLRIDDDNILREVNHIENVKSLDLSGCTRRSQATRFGQYLLASGKYLRRKVDFESSIEAIHLTVGDIISVSTKVTGTSWGHAGRIFANSTVGNSNVFVEHFTYPSIANTIFTANTNPLALRVIKQNSDRVDYYLLSNTNYQLRNTGNVINGFDHGRLVVQKRFNPTTRTFEGNPYAWTANTVPIRHDMWTLGEVDPGNIFTSQSDKLFKVTQVSRTDDHNIRVSGIEYISNVYIDSEIQISYSPIQYKDFSSSLTAPPTPGLDLVSRPTRNPDGSVSYALDINSSTDTTGYPISIKTQFEISYPGSVVDIIGVY
jgi:hypothetical protein